MSYINSFKVLNLPHDQSSWKVWDTIESKGKHTLFVGDNGTGKSTMLTMLNESLNRYHNIMNWSRSYLDAEAIISGIHSTPFQESDIDIDERALYNIARDSFRQIYEFHNLSPKKDMPRSDTINIWDEKYKSTQDSLENILHELEDLPGWKETTSVWIFMEAVEVYSKREKISLDILYWNLVMIMKWIHDQMEWDIQWWYVKLEWKNILVPKRVVMNFEKKDTNESGWEWSKRILWEVKWKTIAFLRHPLKELDVASQDQQTEFLIDWLDPDTQVFMESHDRAFVKEAKKSDKWLVHDLGEKKVEQEV